MLLLCLLLQTDNWRYAPGRNGTEAWLELMAPVSSCGMQHLSSNSAPVIQQGSLLEDVLEVSMHPVDNGATSLEFPAMPPDVLRVVQLFNSRPEHW